MSKLLALPDEILIQTLCNLSILDLLSCKLTCFKLNAIVTSTAEIQYVIALELAGLEDNKSCYLGAAEKAAKVAQAQLAWRKQKPIFTTNVKVEHETSGVYDLTGGVYLLGGRRRLDLRYVPLPDSEEEQPKWKGIGMGETVIDMGLCIDEHDLVVVVTTTRISDEPRLFDIALNFLQFSTGLPHPLAKQTRISAYKNKYARPAVGIEIVGENLVLILAHFLDPLIDTSQPEDRVFIFEWRTGQLKMSFVAPYHSYSGLIFLDEHLLLLPNTQRGALEIWNIPQSLSAPSPSVPICVLQLPLLAPGRSFGPLSCRAEPSPVGAHSLPLKYERDPDSIIAKRQQRAYRLKASEAIIIFNVRIQPLQTGPHPGIALGFSHIYSFFVHRKSILRVVKERRERGGVERPRIDIDFPSCSDLWPRPVLWEEWGPKMTRWLEADDVPTRWITTTSGQRAALISSHASNTEGSGSPIVVLDFNEWTVKRTVYDLHEKMRRVQEKEERRRRKLERQNAKIVKEFQRCKDWMEKIEVQLRRIKALKGSEIASELGEGSSSSSSAGSSTTSEPSSGSSSSSTTAPIPDWDELLRASPEQVQDLLLQHSELSKRLESIDGKITDVLDWERGLPPLPSTTDGEGDEGGKSKEPLKDTGGDADQHADDLSDFSDTESDMGSTISGLESEDSEDDNSPPTHTTTHTAANTANTNDPGAAPTTPPPDEPDSSSSPTRRVRLWCLNFPQTVDRAGPTDQSKLLLRSELKVRVICTTTTTPPFIMANPQLPLAMLYLSSLSNPLADPSIFPKGLVPPRETNVEDPQLHRMSKVLDAMVYFLPVSKGQVFALSLGVGERVTICVAGNDDSEAHFRTACVNGATPDAMIQSVWDGLRSIVLSEPTSLNSRKKELVAYLFERHQGKMQRRFEKRREQCKLFFELASDPVLVSQRAAEHREFLKDARDIFHYTCTFFDLPQEKRKEAYYALYYRLEEARTSYAKRKDTVFCSWWSLELKVRMKCM
ncbi:hypothetical protein MD484_g5358, partial [Candolleomyces efflorescens]